MWRTIDPIILPSDHLIIETLHSIHFSCQLKDRGNGRGNRKGYLFIAQVDNTEWQSYSEREKKINSHSESAKIFAKNSFFEALSPSITLPTYNLNLNCFPGKYIQSGIV